MFLGAIFPEEVTDCGSPIKHHFKIPV